MSDRHLPVATFALLAEAQLAATLLENEGIAATIEGGEVGTVWGGITGLGDQIRVLVAADDAPRAAALIAEAQGHTHLPDDWEDEAEATAVCSLCGAELGEGETVCHSCQTPRDAIMSKSPRQVPRRDDSIRSDTPPGTTDQP